MTPDLWQAIGGLVSLAAAIFAWYIKRTDDKGKKDASDKQEIKDVVNSGDDSRLHSLIDRLRRNKKKR